MNPQRERGLALDVPAARSAERGPSGPERSDESGRGATATATDGRLLTPKGSATRTKIIEAAADLFAAEGYASVTVRQVAARTGLTSGAIYATFRGKADLLVEALRASIAEDLNDVPEQVLMRPLPQIDAFQFTSGDDPRRERLRMLLLEAAVAARTDVDVRAQLDGMLTERLDEWTASHETWQRLAGVDSELDMRSLTALLMCIELGSGVMAAVGMREPTAEQTALLVERLLQALVPERGTRRRPRGARS